jgi:hypothetical protein
VISANKKYVILIVVFNLHILYNNNKMQILVIGDILLDINHYCEVTRNAPEANIPVYNTLNTDYILGGAANVAKNIKILESQVELISVVGEDAFFLVGDGYFDGPPFRFREFGLR